MSVPQPCWAVRPMLSLDIPEVITLAAEEPAAPHWPVHEYARMLAVIADSPARRGAWVLAWNTASDAGSSLAGFSMASQVAGVCELEAVVVRSPLRGARLGEQLVRAVAHWAWAAGAHRLQLEVRVSNIAARRLYERMGLTIDGTRPGYYRNPDEDAVLMSLPLQP